MNILLLTQWFQPEPGFKGLPFAKALRERGHRVQVLTGFPNYPEGKLYTGYRIRPAQREMMDGIPVLRVPLYPSHDASALRRAANYASFACSAAALGPLLVDRADVAYVYHPPASVGLAALSLKLLRGIPYLYDIQDLWPDTLAATGMVRHPLLLRSVDRWCRWVYAQASRIAVLSPGFRLALQQRGVAAGKIEVVYNWCDERPPAARDSALAQETKMAGRFNVLFAGTMGKAQALDAVLAAAKLLRGHPRLPQFVFIGGGIEVERLKNQAQSMALDNVRFLPRCPANEIGRYLQLAEVLLVHLRDDPLFSITIPSKIQAYLSTGRPILCAVRGDAADLVERAGAGLCCPPENPSALAETVRRLMEMPGQELAALGERGRAFYQRELSLEAGTKQFERILHQIVVERRNT